MLSVGEHRTVDDEARLVNEDDIRCVRALVRGDQTALAELYDRYAPLMMAVGQRVLGNRREAEDLLHDVFLEAWRSAKDFEPSRGSVRAWLTMRMRSRALDRLRAAGRAKVVLHPDGRAPERSASSPGDALGDRERVRAAVAQLSEEQRPILEMTYFQGMTGPEVAEALDLPIGTVKSRLSRAIKQLRAALHDQPANVSRRDGTSPGLSAEPPGSGTGLPSGGRS